MDANSFRPPGSSPFQWSANPDDLDARYARAIRKCVGWELQKIYGDVLTAIVPPKIADLLRRLEDVNP